MMYDYFYYYAGVKYHAPYAKLEDAIERWRNDFAKHTVWGVGIVDEKNGIMWIPALPEAQAQKHIREIIENFQSQTGWWQVRRFKVEK